MKNDCTGRRLSDGKLEVFGKIIRDSVGNITSKIGRTVDYASGRNRYIGYLISLDFILQGVKAGRLKGTGSSWNLAKSVFDAQSKDLCYQCRT